jgi:hypothetical protein
MRAAIFIAALAGCAPDIASASYVCGPDETCPPDQACNGPDNKCVIASTAQPFACLAKELHEPDDVLAQALQVPQLDCVSTPFIDHGCLAAGDLQNWYKLSTPGNCTAVEVNVRLDYAVSTETLGLELWDAEGAGAKLVGDSPCATGANADAGDDARCVKLTLGNGHHYGILVKPAGGGDCDGRCNYNRYQLTVQLATPG